jgi:hemolysin III
MDIANTKHSQNYQYSTSEEIANKLTHGLGVILCIIGLIFLFKKANDSVEPMIMVSYMVFGISLLLLYITSTLYHTIPGLELKKSLRKMDHSAIYILIAGTYTPFLLINLQGFYGWGMFGIIWSFAIIGIVLKIFTPIKSKWVSAIIYIIMGWLCVLISRQMWLHVPSQSLIFLGIGGFFYTTGVFFYVWKKLPYHHAIWHIFVMGGSICHFIAVYNNLLA